MKYLVLEKDDLPVVKLFSETVQHKEEARGIPREQILGAGFCCISGFMPGEMIPANAVTCYGISVWGKSTGLQIYSRGVADIDAIRFMLMLPSLHTERSRPNECTCGDYYCQECHGTSDAHTPPQLKGRPQDYTYLDEGGFRK